MNAEHVGIYAHDAAALSRWYGDTLGFKTIRTLEKAGRPPIYFMQGEEGLIVEILPTSERSQQRKLNDPGYSHIGILVKDFDQTAEGLASKGVHLHDVRKTSNGWTIGYFEDPEGNRLELVYRPQEG